MNRAALAFRRCADIPAGLWRWIDFRAPEIASKGDGSILVVPAALDALQAARTAVARPFRILSAYRDPIHNALVGGAPMSEHKAGVAFDIATAGHDRGELLAACRSAGFRGFGFYATFLHADMGRRREWGSWAG